MGQPVQPVWQQADYAFYSDGTETGATLIGSAGSQQTLDTGTAYHVRVAINETAGTNQDPNLTLRWQYNLNAGGWLNISTTTPIQFVDNANLTDGEVTTNRHPAGTGTFVAGRVFESINDAATVYASTGSDHTEAVAHLQIDAAQVLDADEILVRVIEGDGTVFGGAYTDADIDVNLVVSSQTISVPHVASTVTAHTLTASPGSVTQSVQHVSSTSTAHALTATPSSVTQAIPHVAETDTANVIEPLHGVGGLGVWGALGYWSEVTAINQSVPHVAETGATHVIAPALGTVTQSVPQVSEADTTHILTATQGSVTQSVPQVTETDSAKAITAILGSVTQSVPQVSGIASAHAITVSIGSITQPVPRVAEADSTKIITVNASAVTQAIPHTTEVDVTHVLAVGDGSITELIPHVTTVDTAHAIGAYPEANSFVKTWSDDYENLPTNSFAYGKTELSGIVTGDAYQMESEASDGADVSGTTLGVLTLTGGTPYAVRTIIYSIHDASDGTWGSTGTITVLPQIVQASEADTAHTITVNQSGNTTVAIPRVSALSAAHIITPTAGSVTQSIPRVLETDSAHAVNVQQSTLITVPRVTTIGAAKNITPVLFFSGALARVLESDITHNLVPDVGQVSVGITKVFESDSAHELLPRITLGGTYNAHQYFTSGGTVTIEVYDPETGLEVSTDSANCPELGNSGMYVWDASNLTTQPIGFKNYSFKMTDDGGTNWKGGGFNVFDQTAVEQIQEIHGKLIELWRIRGLDPENPMTADKDAGTITAGDIYLTVTGDGVTKAIMTRDAEPSLVIDELSNFVTDEFGNFIEG